MKKIAFVVCVVVLLATACGKSKNTASPTTTTVPATTTTTTQLVNASDLRVKVNGLMLEYAMTTAKATNALLGGRSGQSTAFSSQLNLNGSELADLIKATYGPDAQSKFSGIWSAHTGYLFDYANGAAKSDKTTQDGAVFVLNNTFVPQFADVYGTLTGASKDASTKLAAEHVSLMKAVIDDQASKNWAKLTTDEPAAFAQMQKLADLLSGSIAQKDSVIYPATGTTKASDLRLNMNRALVTQTYLQTSTTDALIGGRNDEYTAFSKLLAANANAIATNLRAVSETDASAFNALWQSQNAYFMDYTTAASKHDGPAKDKAADELKTAFVPKFDDYLVNSAGIDRALCDQKVSDVIAQTKSVIDDQVDQKWNDEASDSRGLMTKAQSLADAISSAYVHKLLI